MTRSKYLLGASVLVLCIGSGLNSLVPLGVRSVIAELEAGTIPTGYAMALLGLAAVAALFFAGGCYAILNFLDRWLLTKRVGAFSSFVRARSWDTREYTTGDVASRIVSDSQLSRGMYETLVFQLPIVAVTLIGTFIALMYIDPVFALVIFVVAIVYLCAMLLFTLRIVSVTRSIQARNGTLVNYVVDSLGNLSIVQPAHAQDFFCEAMDQRSREIMYETRKLNRLAVGASPLPGVLQQVAVVAVILLGAQRFVAGEIQAADIVSATMYCAQVFAPITLLTQGISRFGSAKASHERVMEIAGLPTPDLRSPDPRSSAPSAHVAPSVDTGLAERRVDVYRQLDSLISDLDAVSIRWLDDIILVEGPSGAGKTTAMERLLGLRPSADGSTDWSGRATYVDQKVSTPAIRLRELVNLDREAGAWRSERELRSRDEWNTLNMDQFRDTALDDVLGDELRMSGGELQRVALLRSSFSDKPIAVLDEPLAHLDPSNRAIASSFIHDLTRDKVVVVASHLPLAERSPVRRAASVHLAPVAERTPA